MITMITGGSGSGKSAYAEECLCQTGASFRIYLATMEVFGEEGRRRVERHKALRAGKGFVTVERPRNLAGVAVMTPWEETAVLLECMSNLTANEFFAGGRAVTEAEEPFVEAKIIHGIGVLSSQAKDLILVTNEVFSDGIAYPEETMRYMAFLGRMNRKLAQMADRVVEVVCGIPVVGKEAKG